MKRKKKMEIVRTRPNLYHVPRLKTLTGNTRLVPFSLSEKRKKKAFRLKNQNLEEDLLSDGVGGPIASAAEERRRIGSLDDDVLHVAPRQRRIRLQRQSTQSRRQGCGSGSAGVLERGKGRGRERAQN